MEILWLCVLIHCLSGTWGFVARPSFAAPSSLAQRGPLQRPQISQQQQQAEPVNTVTVVCHPDSLEVIIKADMFAVSAPVNSHELHLGGENREFCRAVAASEDEYRIVVGLEDCGTKHWMSEDSLVYTNVLMFSPLTSNGVIHMEEAMIPIECRYERKYSLSSSSLMPSWSPFSSTQAVTENLQFSLKLMTDDWMHERGVNVFYLGEPINLEASVQVGHHMGLRVFLSSCVATLQPDVHSDPKYNFIENGCLIDSRLPDSKAHFLTRARDDELQLTFDSFKFHNDDRAELYITCHLKAVPVNDPEAPNKACTFINGRWRSADGNDYLCGYCNSPSDVTKVSTKSNLPGVFGPRGFGRPDHEPMWRSGLKTNHVWDHEAKVGPLNILPFAKSLPLPVDKVPTIHFKRHRPAPYGSQWRSGLNRFALEKEPLPDSKHDSDAENETKDYSKDDKDLEDEADLSVEMILPRNETAPIYNQLDVETSNVTAASDYLLTDPKK